ncbi:MAG TPA: 16S rRNA (guanine(966)-N(2))-methyltransferase RsmD [Vicinamibacterales bacterium]|nr:16S rRNA (guanine(966)-N(2))-methyltransferase RsmD [Vicinamibacterales bacterium]
MRIVAGLFRGRRLNGPTWEGLRPTSDKLRETLFNILGARIPGARVLDGYAGTGAVGLEALSRGAASVLFVERDRRAAALIRKNLAQCGVEERYTIESRDLAEVLRRLEPGVTFDFIFLDPPYDHPPTIAVLDEAGQRLGPDGILVLERATRRGFEVPADLDRVRDVKSGDSTLTFLARRPGAGAATEQR